MDSQIKNKLVTEIFWLSGIIMVLAALEYVIIVFFDFYAVFSLHIQVFIGLVIIAYIIRMIARMGKQGLSYLMMNKKKPGKRE